MEGDADDADNLKEPLFVPIKVEADFATMSDEAIGEGNIEARENTEDGDISKNSLKEDVGNEEFLKPLFVAIKSESPLEESTMEENCEVTESKEDGISHETRFPGSEIPEYRMRELDNSLTSPVEGTLSQCALSNQTCTTGSYSLAHKTSEESRYRCALCEKSYMRKKDLVSHIRLHTEEKIVRCSVCGKAFSYDCYLAVHMRSHTGEQPFSCSVCKKMFTIKASLTTHMLSHTGIKPYKCSVCGKSFSRGHSLTSHKRIHSGEKPYKCKLCGREFSQKHSLAYHIRTHTGERPFACENCGRRFTARARLLYHRRHVHSAASLVH